MVPLPRHFSVTHAWRCSSEAPPQKVKSSKQMRPARVEAEVVDERALDGVHKLFGAAQQRVCGSRRGCHTERTTRGLCGERRGERPRAPPQGANSGAASSVMPRGTRRGRRAALKRDPLCPIVRKAAQQWTEEDENPPRATMAHLLSGACLASRPDGSSEWRLARAQTGTAISKV